MTCSRRGWATIILIGAFVFATAGMTRADLIALETENASIDNSADNGSIGWEIKSPGDLSDDPATASGGRYVVNTETGGAPPSDTMTWSVNFTETGTWGVYARVAFTTDDFEGTEDAAGNNDSFYFDNNPNGAAAWTTVNSLAVSTGSWKWFGVDTQSPGVLNVTSTGAANWTVANREDGIMIDAFVLAPPGATPTATDLELALAGTQVYTPVDDTYGRRGQATTVFGNDQDLLVKKEGASGTGTTTRKAVIEFEITPQTVSDAQLVLEVLEMTNAGGSNFHVWGIKDGVSIEDFDESIANYNTFLPPFDDSGDGMSNGSSLLHQSTALGTFFADSSDVGGTVTFTSQDLIDFINADTNGRITIAITRAVDDITFNSRFASSENATRNGPRLLLTEDIPAPAALPAGLALLGFVALRRR